MKSAFIAIDSGGTRTNVTIEVEGLSERSYQSTHVIAGTTPSSLYEEELQQILSRADGQLEDVLPEIDSVYLFMGSAGFSHSTRDDIARAMELVIPTVLDHKVVAAGAANDGTALLLGHRAHGIVIAGTGSTVMIRDPEGQIHIAGGHDWVGCDSGSGFWVGLRGIRQAAKDFEDGISSDLHDRFREVYGVRADDDQAFIAKLRELAMADSEMKGEVARFAAAVCHAAGRGDVNSQDIVKAEAEDLADIAASAIRRRIGITALTEGVHFVQCGGLLSNSFYRDLFEKQVGRRLMNREDQLAEIQWTRVDTGKESVLALARALKDDIESLTKVPRQFAPVLLRFDD